MISRRTFGLVMVIAASAVGALAGDDHPIRIVPEEYMAHGLTNELCLGGRPRKRLPTDYAGLPTCPTAERNHIVPRCLGGPDTLENLEYQPWAEANPDDVRERRMCEAYCRGEITLEAARAQFHRTYGLTCPQ